MRQIFLVSEDTVIGETSKVLVFSGLKFLGAYILMCVMKPH